MIYKNQDGTCTISSGHAWLPGVYQDERTARVAFRLPNTDLQSLQDTVNKHHESADKRVISYEMVINRLRENRG